MGVRGTSNNLHTDGGEKSVGAFSALRVLRAVSALIPALIPALIAFPFGPGPLFGCDPLPRSTT